MSSDTPVSSAPRPRSRSWGRLGVIVLISVGVLGACALALLVGFFFVRISYQNFRIQGATMQPALRSDDYVMLHRQAYVGDSRPQRGDIVVYRPLSTPDRSFIHRIIGLPGETIEIQSGAVQINGRKLVEPYASVGSYSVQRLTLGQDEYYVLGDNRNNAADSHTRGPIPLDTIEGKIVFIYWPPQRWGAISAPTYEK